MVEHNRPLGPWVKRLITHFMAKEAIPDGGGFADGLKFLTDKDAILAAAKNGTVLAFEAIDLLKAAPDCKWETDEDCAKVICEAIQERRK